MDDRPRLSLRFLYLAICCVFQNFTAGSLYSFGRYADDVKNNQQFSQVQMLLLGSLILFSGCILSYPITTIANRGYPISMGLLTAAMAFVGYIVPSFAFSDAYSLSYPLMLLCFSFVGIGLLGMSFLCMVPIAQLWEGPASAAAMATMQMFYGVGNIFWPLIYESLDLHRFFLLLAILVGGSFILITFLLRHVAARTSNVHGPEEENRLLSTQNPDDNEKSSILSVFLMSMRDKSLIATISIFLVTFGLSVNFVNNSESMLQAVEGSVCDATHIITYCGVSHTAGRIVVTAVSLLDVLYDGQALLFNPILWTVILCLIQTCLYIAAATTTLSCTLVWLYAQMAAFSYALSWSLFMSVLAKVASQSKVFSKHLGEVMSIATMLSPSFGPVLFTILFGVVYDSHGFTAPDGGIQCVGHSCFFVSFVVGAVCAAMSCAACTWLLVSTSRHRS